MQLGSVVSLSRTFGSLCVRQNSGFNLPSLFHQISVGCNISSRCLTVKISKTSQMPKKAPRSAYIIFSNEKMPEIKEANPDVKAVKDLSKIIGPMWRNLTEEQRQVYKELHSKEKEELHRVREAYLKSLTEEQRQRLDKENEAVKKKREHKKLKALRKKMGRPRPAGINAYSLFVKSRMLERGDAPVSMYMKGLSDFWKKMPEDDKKPLEEEAIKNRVKYHEDLQEWTARMISTGNMKVVSKGDLKTLKSSGDIGDKETVKSDADIPRAKKADRETKAHPGNDGKPKPKKEDTGKGEHKSGTKD